MNFHEHQISAVHTSVYSDQRISFAHTFIVMVRFLFLNSYLGQD